MTISSFRKLKKGRIDLHKRLNSVWFNSRMYHGNAEKQPLPSHGADERFHTESLDLNLY